MNIQTQNKTPGLFQLAYGCITIESDCGTPALWNVMTEDFVVKNFGWNVALSRSPKVGRTSAAAAMSRLRYSSESETWISICWFGEMCVHSGLAPPLTEPLFAEGWTWQSRRGLMKHLHDRLEPTCGSTLPLPLNKPHALCTSILKDSLSIT